MKVPVFRIAVLCAVPLAAGAAAWHSTTRPAVGQAPAAVPLQYSASALRRTTLRRSEAEHLDDARRAWNLSKEEWLRYQELVRGPRGYWSPGLDPIAALGIHATTDAERRRLAERFVEMENQRIQGELAFQRAVNTVVQARYGEQQRELP